MINSVKISAALKSCLDEAVNGYGEHPFARMQALLYSLRADPNWTDAEVMEVQMSLIRVLTSRLAGLESARCADSRHAESERAVNFLV
jgi:hypothetical protein